MFKDSVLYYIELILFHVDIFQDYIINLGTLKLHPLYYFNNFILLNSSSLVELEVRSFVSHFVL